MTQPRCVDGVRPVVKPRPDKAATGDGQRERYRHCPQATGKENGKDHDVTKGMGVYLGPSESATIRAADASLKLFHLVVPQIPK